MPTTLPGFRDAVHDAQQSFRHILEALSRPGLIQTIAADLSTPPGLMPATAAACLTLLDLEVTVWLQLGFDADVQQWLLFHTGCRFVNQPGAANFAIVSDSNQCPELAAFNVGTAEYPEASTLLLLQVPSLVGGEAVHLRGPGVNGQVQISPQVPPGFWLQWQENAASYPLGVDVVLMSDRHLIGLPRTVQALQATEGSIA